MGPKIPSLEFLAKVWKKYFHIWKKPPKMPKSGTKNALFGYFRARIWKTYYCHIRNQHPQIYQKKTELSKFETNNPLFGYFWASVISKVSNVECVKNESLSHTVYFGIGSTFSKIPGSTFFKGQGSGPRLHFKVCPFLNCEFTWKLYISLNY